MTKKIGQKSLFFSPTFRPARPFIFIFCRSDFWVTSFPWVWGSLPYYPGNGPQFFFFLKNFLKKIGQKSSFFLKNLGKKLTKNLHFFEKFWEKIGQNLHFFLKILVASYILMNIFAKSASISLILAVKPAYRPNKKENNNFFLTKSCWKSPNFNENAKKTAKIPSKTSKIPKSEKKFHQLWRKKNNFFL